MTAILSAATGLIRNEEREGGGEFLVNFCVSRMDCLKWFLWEFLNETNRPAFMKRNLLEHGMFGF